MKVAFDARYLTSAPSGIGTYQSNLVRELLACDSDLHLLLVTRDRGIAQQFNSDRCQEWVYDVPPRSFRTLYDLSRRLRGQSFDLFHATFNIIPSGLRRPVVATLHDIMQIQDPANIDLRLYVQCTAGLFWRMGMKRAIYGADRIVTVSEATRDAILERFTDVSSDKFDVTPLGADPFFSEPTPTVDLDRARATLGFESPFILTVGNESPHKNHYRAVEAFMRAAEHAPELRFVIVRRSVRRDARLQTLLRNPDVAARVHVLDEVDRPLLRALYRSAAIFFFPSWVEGFGLPVLEAMASECPVVTSDRSASAEVAGSAAIKVSPYDVSAMADALVRVHTATEVRDRLIAAGRDRATSFSWARTATTTLEAYRKLLADA
jgi:glycosyltransferase involved in cell wall biosynthesis